MSMVTVSRRGAAAGAFLVLEDELDFLSDFLSSFFLSSGFFCAKIFSKKFHEQVGLNGII